MKMRRMVYTKCSNERAVDFSLRTMIFEDCTGKRSVEKQPDTMKAKEHVKKMYDWYIELENQFQATDIRINRCELTDQGVAFEYLEGTTLENVLDDCIEQNDRQSAENLVDKYFSILLAVHRDVPFHMTDQFKIIFGEMDIEETEVCGRVTNIDALFSNILISEDGQWNMLDYEWTFDFPVPVKFLIYRILFYYCHEHEKRKCIMEWIPWEKYGISEDMEDVFEKMEFNFQKYIQGVRVPIRDMFDYISPGIIRLDEMQYLGKNRILSQKVQIYESTSEHPTEQDSYYISLNKDNHFESDFNIKQELNYFRIDPCSRQCMIKNMLIQCEDTDCSYSTNGIEIAENVLFFGTSDPYFLLNDVKKYIDKAVKVSFDVEFIESMAAESILFYIDKKRELEMSLNQMNLLANQQKTRVEQLSQHISELSERIQRLEANCRDLDASLSAKREENEVLKDKINVMENTKVWKAYQKYKSIGQKQ